MSGDDDDDILDALEKWDKGGSNVKQKSQPSLSESKMTISDDDDESSIGSDLSIPDIEENTSESKGKLPVAAARSDSTDAGSSQKGGKKELSTFHSKEMKSEGAHGMSKSSSPTLSDKKDDATGRDDSHGSPEKSKKGSISEYIYCCLPP